MAEYSVEYYFIDKDGNKSIPLKRNCYGALIRNYAPFKQNEKFVTLLDNYYFDNKKEEEVRHFYKFLQSIPEFTHLFPNELIEEFYTERKLTFDLKEINGLQLFTVLTILRMVRDEYEVIQEIYRKIELNKKYKFSNLHLLRIISKFIGPANNHSLISGKIDPFKEIDLSKREEWISTKSVKETGFVPKINPTFSDDPEKYWEPGKISEQDYLKVILTEEEFQAELEKEKKKKADKMHKIQKIRLNRSNPNVYLFPMMT